jgi:iron complex outermembrane receptor protein
LFESENHAVKLAFRDAHNLLVIEGALEDSPYQGFVNQRMDMVENRGRLLNAKYLGHFGFGFLEARFFYHSTKHEMDILEDKKPGEMPMWVDGVDAGYALKTEINLTPADIVRIGNEFHHQELEDRWPPVPGSMMMGPYTYRNINHGTRDRLGTFAEWEHAFSPAISTMLGVRNDMVWMDTGDVQAYSPEDCLMRMGMMCMMPNPDAAAAQAFNALDRDRTDANFDATVQVRFEPSATQGYEIGYARKTRSPNLYERYAWGVGNMAANMIGWYGDANGYIGNPDLKPEVANTVSLTAGWHDPAKAEWQLRVTPYYTHVEDYIDADFVAEQMRGMGMAAAPTGFVTMRFANHDARLYGVNMSGNMPLWSDPAAGHFGLSGVLSYVDGKNLDTGDDLYHMMPLNGRLALTHSLGGWSSAIELDLVADKDEVNATRREPTTSGYTLVNVRTSYEWNNLRLDLGVENVFDELYFHPLGGVDFAGYKAAGSTGTIGPVPGEGRSFNVGATVKF